MACYSVVEDLPRRQDASLETNAAPRTRDVVQNGGSTTFVFVPWILDRTKRVPRTNMRTIRGKGKRQKSRWKREGVIPKENRGRARGNGVESGENTMQVSATRNTTMVQRSRKLILRLS